MHSNGKVLDQPDLSSFHENWRNFPPEQLLAYSGQYVAWSPDGTRILVSGATREEVAEKLEAAGIHFSQVVHDYIDPPLG
jgi:hypothetical protein